MKRKIIKLGASTLVASLPSKWIKEHELFSGNEINVEESEDGSLIISAEHLTQVKKKKEISFDIHDMGLKSLEILLTHSYRKGYDRIKFQELDDERLELIQAITNRSLLGFEVIDITSNSCIVENIAEPSENKYDVIFRRAMLNIKELYVIIKHSMQNNSYDISKVNNIREQIDKFVYFCRRTIYTSKDSDNVFDFELMSYLMQHSHKLFYMYKFLVDKNVKVNNSVIELLDISMNFFDMFYHAAFEKDISKLHEVTKKGREYQDGICMELLEKSKGNNSIAISFINQAIRINQLSVSPAVGKLI